MVDELDRFCPSCGKPATLEELRDLGSCKACHGVLNPVISIEELSFSLQICPSCCRFREKGPVQGQWIVPEEKKLDEIWLQTLYMHLMDDLPDHEEFEYYIDMKKRPEDPWRPHIKHGVHLILQVVKDQSSHASGMVGELSREDPLNVDEDEGEDLLKEIPVAITYTVGMCEECALVKAGYHNSVVQLRCDSARKEVATVMKGLVADVLAYSKDHEYHGIFPVSKVEEVKGGIDLHLVSRKYGKVIARFLKQRYNSTVTESFKVVGVDKTTGGSLKRLFFSVRIFPFVTGDVFMMGEGQGASPFLIEKVAADVITVRGLLDGEASRKDPKAFSREGLVFESGVDEVVQLQLVSEDKGDGTLVLMRLDNYIEVELARPPWLGELGESTTLEGFERGDVLYLLPKRRSGSLGIDIDGSVGD